MKRASLRATLLLCFGILVALMGCAGSGISANDGTWFVRLSSEQTLYKEIAVLTTRGDHIDFVGHVDSSQQDKFKTVSAMLNEKSGFSMNPVQVDFALQDVGSFVERPLTINIADDCPIAVGQLVIQVDSNPNQEVTINALVLAQLVDAELSDISIPAGTSIDVPVNFVVRGNTEGPVPITVAGGQNTPLTFTTTLTPTMVLHSPTPVQSMLHISSPLSAANNTYDMGLRVDGIYTIKTFKVNVTAPDTDAPFDFSATPLEVIAPNGQASIQSITFSLQAHNSDFHRNVYIHWSSPEEVVPSPPTQDAAKFVTSGGATTFPIIINRHVTSHTNPIPITFTASDPVTNTSRSITIMVKDH